METTPSPAPPVYTPAPSRGMFGTNIPSSVAFAVGILLFFLPFVEIKCGSTPLLDKTGFSFVKGEKKWSDKKQNSPFGGNDSLSKSSMTDGEKDPGNARYFVIAAMALGVIGFALSFGNAKTAGNAGIMAGILSAGALIAFMIDLKKSFNDSMKKEAMDKGSESLGGLGDIKVTLAFTPWFYIAVLAFLAAAFFCYKRMASVKV